MRTLIVIVILGMLLIGSSSFAVFMKMSNNELETKLDSIELEYRKNISILEEKIRNLSDNELFIKFYFKAEYKYVLALDLENDSITKSNLADAFYNNSQWDDAIAYYGYAMNNCSNAIQKYEEARNLYLEAKNYTNNSLYQKLCSVCYNIMDSASKALYYLYESMKYMQSACEYYKKGDYVNGNDEVVKANANVILYNDELKVLENYNVEFKNVLAKIE